MQAAVAPLEDHQRESARAAGPKVSSKGVVAATDMEDIGDAFEAAASPHSSAAPPLLRKKVHAGARDKAPPTFAKRIQMRTRHTTRAHAKVPRMQTMPKIASSEEEATLHGRRKQ